MIFVRRRHRVGLCCQHRLICSARPPLSFRILYIVPSFIIVAAFLHIHTHTHTHTYTQTDRYIRSFHREIYFSFYFFPTRPPFARLYPFILSLASTPPSERPLCRRYITELPLAFPSRAPKRLDEVLPSGVVVGLSSESSFRQCISL
jgi:hypothetical protein